MKSRRGFLLASETLKIVIAVICIGFLVYFLVSVYYSNTKNTKISHAKATLEKVSEIVELSGEGRVDGVTPVGWYFFSFVDEKKPNACAGDNCVCICKKRIPDFFDKQAETCDDAGSCLVIENLGFFEPFRIVKLKEGFTSVRIKKINNELFLEAI